MQATITLDLYDGDDLIRRTEIECPKDLGDAKEVYDFLWRAAGSLAEVFINKGKER